MKNEGSMIFFLLLVLHLDIIISLRLKNSIKVVASTGILSNFDNQKAYLNSNKEDLSSRDIAQSSKILHNIFKSRPLYRAKKIKAEILKLARSTKSDLKLKRLQNGILPIGYPSQLVKKAFNFRNDNRNFQRLMDEPNKYYRVCHYPMFSNSPLKWCSFQFGIEELSGNRMTICQNSFCKLCCTNLKVIFDFEINPSNAEKKNCQSKCDQLYGIARKEQLPPPPRDLSLGMTSDHPALSCADIKKWGSQLSGKYWIKQGDKGSARVFCDMDSDMGGWTLFFNYRHKPDQKIEINNSMIPSSLEDNSHVKLSEMSFTTADVQELRFACTEVNSSSRIFIDFKTHSTDAIQTALTGDQSKLNSNSLNGSVDLDGPIGFARSLSADEISNNIVTEFNNSNRANDSHFWNYPFGIGRRMWNAGGNDKYECGSSHESMVDLPELSLTHHSVYFRGKPASTSYASKRYYQRTNNIIK